MASFLCTWDNVEGCLSGPTRRCGNERANEGAKLLLLVGLVLRAKTRSFNVLVAPARALAIAPALTPALTPASGLALAPALAPGLPLLLPPNSFPHVSLAIALATSV